jgi:hypothetical protein
MLEPGTQKSLIVSEFNGMWQSFFSGVFNLHAINETFL